MTQRPWMNWPLAILGVLALLAVSVLPACSTAEGEYSTPDYAARAKAGRDEIWIVPTTAPGATMGPTTSGDGLGGATGDHAGGSAGLAAAGGRGSGFGAGGAGGARGAGGVPAGALALPGSAILAVRRADGQLAPMPPKRTDVEALISGCIASVGVRQQFSNPAAEKIEAVYVFPLPANAGVSEFTMTIGERHIRGIVRERTEAQRIYEQARTQGYVVSLMTQERPNVFTQNVANIEPGKSIDVAIRYFHTLTYVDGWLEWVFPMVVGPRYNPAAKDEVAGRSLLPERSGQDLGLKVTVDAGMKIEELVSVNHKIRQSAGPNQSTVVELDPADAYPNKDFVLRFKVAGSQVKTGLWVQQDKAGGEGTAGGAGGRGGWFALMLVPPADVAGPAQGPALTNVQVQFGGMQVSEVYPRRIPELLAGRTVVITGRFTGVPAGAVTIAGRAGDQPVTYTLPTAEAVQENPAIALVWARAKLADLHDAAVLEHRDVSADVKATALSYGLMSEYTSFVVVDATGRTGGGAGVRVVVPEGEGDGARNETTVQDEGR